jgi:hypothetical protein
MKNNYRSFVAALLWMTVFCGMARVFTVSWT